mgnify:FL=1
MSYEEILMRCVPVIMSEMSKRYYKGLEDGSRYLNSPMDIPSVVARDSAELADALIAEIKLRNNNQSTTPHENMV